MPAPSSHVFWICGLSGAGKSTLAAALVAALRTAGRPVLELDGDALRHGLCSGLGFSDADRAENLRRAAEVARLGLDSGLCVVASFITPRESHRQLARQLIGAGKFSLVWADAPQMTGIGSSFEAPAGADLVLSTAANSPEESARTLIQFALTRLSVRG